MIWARPPRGAQAHYSRRHIHLPGFCFPDCWPSRFIDTDPLRRGHRMPCWSWGSSSRGGRVCLVVGLVRLIPNSAQAGICTNTESGCFSEKELYSATRTSMKATLKSVRVFFHGVCTGEVHEATFTSHIPGSRPLYQTSTSAKHSVGGRPRSTWRTAKCATRSRV